MHPFLSLSHTLTHTRVHTHAHRELFRKGLIADAMTEVKKGNEKGYMSSPDLAKHVIEQLALAGLKVGCVRGELHELFSAFITI